MEKHLLILIAEFAYTHESGFLKETLMKEIHPSDVQKLILDKYFENAYEAGGGRTSDLETPFFVFRKGNDLALESAFFAVKQDTIFSYIDYLELQEARKSSKSAMRWAMAAILINIVAIAVQIYTSRSTEVDESQFVEIKNLISSEIKK